MMLPKLRAEKALLAEYARPAYSQEKFLAALVRFIVTDNQVSTPLEVNGTMLIVFQSLDVIECPEFRDLLLLLRDDFKDTQILHCCKLRELILYQWSTYFKDLRKDLEVHPFSFVSTSINHFLTAGTWWH